MFAICTCQLRNTVSDTFTVLNTLKWSDITFKITQETTNQQQLHCSDQNKVSTIIINTADKIALGYLEIVKLTVVSVTF